MGKVILRDASVTVNSIDLSDHVTKVTITSQKDHIDVTTMGASSKEYLLGLGDGSIQIDLTQDYAAAEVDATLWPIHTGSTVVPIVVKPTSAAVGTANPSYTMLGVLPDYTPIDGGVGALSAVSVTFMNADQSGIVRATS